MRIPIMALETLIIFGLAIHSYGQGSNRSVVLPESAAQQLAQPCSRGGPPHFEATWMPKPADAQAMEARLSQITRLRSRGGAVGMRLRRPEKYYRQYVGIVVKGRRLIYINGICEEDPPARWREEAIDVCDGGCNWGVVYDTETKRFSDLEMNGVG